VVRSFFDAPSCRNGILGQGAARPFGSSGLFHWCPGEVATSVEGRVGGSTDEGSLQKVRLMMQLNCDPSIELLPVLLCDSHDNFGIFIPNMERQNGLL
jgi:hypothetical protein